MKLKSEIENKNDENLNDENNLDNNLDNQDNNNQQQIDNQEYNSSTNKSDSSNLNSRTNSFLLDYESSGQSNNNKMIASRAFQKAQDYRARVVTFYMNGDPFK